RARRSRPPCGGGRRVSQPPDRGSRSRAPRGGRRSAPRGRRGAPPTLPGVDVENLLSVQFLDLTVQGWLEELGEPGPAPGGGSAAAITAAMAAALVGMAARLSEDSWP